jgi:hypothetical protein
MDNSWADIFTDAEARAAEYSDSDSEGSTYFPGMENDLDGVEEEEVIGPAIQCQRTQHLRAHMTGRMVRCWHDGFLSSKRMIFLEKYVVGHKYLQGLVAEM